MVSILEKIDAALDSLNEKKREYLGASIIGTECDRELWYKIHSFRPELSPRKKRIFRLGHSIEKEVIDLLSLAGFQLFTHKENGEQWGFKSGPFAGHCDGVLKDGDTPYVFDVKSTKNSFFNQYKKKGVRAVSKEYYIQLLLYMKYLKVSQGLIIFYNKDNSEIHVEQIEADNDLVSAYEDRALEISQTETEPERKWPDKTWWKCRLCSYRDECWDKKD